MFPNAMMMQPQTWNDILGDDDRGARRARVGLDAAERFEAAPFASSEVELGLRC